MNTDVFGVEGQVDFLIFDAMQNEFDDMDVSACSGGDDSINAWNEDGDSVNPTTFNASIRVATALKKIKWDSIQYDIEEGMAAQESWI